MDNEERKRLAAERSSEVNKGNTHSSKINRLAADTLRRVLIQEEAIRLRNVTEALVAKAESGDVSAIKEVFDRIDGKSVAAFISNALAIDQDLPDPLPPYATL